MSITDEDADRGLSKVELAMIAAEIDRGVTKTEAVKNVMAMRARRAGSRTHGTSTGRANRTRPVKQIGQIFRGG